MSLVTEPQNQRLPPFPVRRFTVAEYHRLGEVGVLTEDDRVELLEGWIVPKMMHNPAHDGTVSVMNRQLTESIAPEWIIRIQSAITTQDSEPEPDLAIVRAPERRYMQRHPDHEDIALVVEVAESSLARDRDKRGLYARANIPVYWIVNLVDRQIEVYTEPTGPDTDPGFRCREAFLLDDQIPVIIGGKQVALLTVRDLLP
jgi:hypothetical protein